MVTCAIPSAAEVIDRIVAVVNGSIITLSDLHAAQRFGLVADASGDWRQQVRERLIERRLMLAEVERYGPQPPAAEAVEAAVAASRARFASEEAFEAALRETGFTREELRRQHRDTLRLDTYMRQRFGASVQPSEEEILAYYRAHQAAFTRGGVLRPYDEARADIRNALMAERRAESVREWIAGLRRRADVSVLPLR
jgi:parvulin-like peptidyl-prolyl isomerase